MLYSRAGDYPSGQAMLYAESFSTNTAEGACPKCHGLGRIYEVTEKSMVPDDSLTIRQRAIAAWPTAWQGQNLRDILVTLGYDVDKPWRELSKKDRHWILFTDEQPTVPVYAGLTPEQTREALRRKLEPSYHGTFTGARRYVLSTFANSQSAMMKRRVAQFMLSSECPVCHGKRLRPESLRVKFGGMDIAEISSLPMKRLESIFRSCAENRGPTKTKPDWQHPEKAIVAKRISQDILARLEVLLDLGLGYLSLERSTPTLSPGELQRLRLATQVHSNLFGVVYVLDEPSAGLHPADTDALLKALHRLKESGNTLFVVEHEIEVMRSADWLVDVGPGAGEKGGQILYSGPPDGLRAVTASKTRQYIFSEGHSTGRSPRKPRGWIRLQGISLNNLEHLDAAIPLGVFTSVTGVSGSGKSSLISQALVDLVAKRLGQKIELDQADDAEELEQSAPMTAAGEIVSGLEGLRRMVKVDQRPIGRTPRSNMATYTGLFDHVRKLFAATKLARSRGYDAGQFSFNVAKGRCPTCSGEGSVCVELLFLPSVYAPCPTCHGARFNPKTLEIKYREKDISQVLALTVEAALDFFSDEPAVQRSLNVLSDVGLGYLKLGQPATELSGGEAQRIKLATELQRTQHGDTLYILDEPTTGLHPSDVDRLQAQLDGLVEAGNTVVVIEHDMQIVAESDWVIDMGPGAGDEGGTIVAIGPPSEVMKSERSKTAHYLGKYIHP
jgi:excinuclease ABC subunit A